MAIRLEKVKVDIKTYPNAGREGIVYLNGQPYYVALVSHGYRFEKWGQAELHEREQHGVTCRGGKATHCSCGWHGYTGKTCKHMQAATDLLKTF